MNARMPVLLRRRGRMGVPVLEPHAKLPPSSSLANSRRWLSDGMRFKQCCRAEVPERLGPAAHGVERGS